MNNKIVLTLMLLAFVACKKKQSDPEIPDPPASFKIEENVGGKWVETPSVLVYNGVRFTASDLYESYKWTIGYDTRTFTTRVTGLSFPDGGDNFVNIRLIAKKKAQHIKDTKDDGVDTLTRTMSILKWEESRIIGRYKGHVTTRPDDEFIMSVKYITYGSEPGFYIKGINKDCVGSPEGSLYGGSTRYYANEGLENCVPGATGLYFNANGWVGGGCKNPMGLAYLTSQNDIQVDYQITEQDAQDWKNFIKTNETFVGTRIQ
jgi:hypothetical protein